MLLHLMPLLLNTLVGWTIHSLGSKPLIGLCNYLLVAVRWTQSSKPAKVHSLILLLILSHLYHFWCLPFLSLHMISLAKEMEGIKLIHSKSFIHVNFTIAPQNNAKRPNSTPSQQQKKKRKKEFDMSKYCLRHIALKIAYRSPFRSMHKFLSYFAYI